MPRSQVKHRDSIDGNRLRPRGTYRIRIWNGETPPTNEANPDNDGEKIDFLNYVDSKGNIYTQPFLMRSLNSKNINCSLILNGEKLLVYGDNGVWWIDKNSKRNRVTFLKLPK